MNARNPRLYSSPLSALRKYTKTENRQEAVAAIVNEIRLAAKTRGYSEGIVRPPYDPAIFASVLGVREIRTSTKPVQGSVSIIEGQPVIEVSEETKTKGGWRFTVAHEVGHLVLWYAQKKLNADFRPRRVRSELVESLCNEIATETLSPRMEVLHYWNSIGKMDHPSGKGLHMVQYVAKTYKMTMQSAALRFVEVCAPQTGVTLLDLENRVVVWSCGPQDAGAVCNHLPPRFRTELNDVERETGQVTVPMEGKVGWSMIPLAWKRLSNGLYLIVTIH